MNRGLQYRKRAISPKEFLEKEFDAITLSDKFQSLIGTPQLTGSWIIWGMSGNGKTTFALQLAKEMARHSKVLYNSFEEGVSLSLQQSFKDVNMMDVNGKFYLLDGEPIEALIGRLESDKKAKVIFIDSIQHSNLTKEQYQEMMQRFKNRLFVFISHAEGKEPAKQLAQSIRYASNVKIRVEGFVAHAQSRFRGGQPYVISEEMARQFSAE